jgi:hypothetical protein
MGGRLYDPSPRIISSKTLVTTSPNVLLVPIKIIGQNDNRVGFMLYNNSANSAYITYGAANGSSTCSFILATFTQYVHMATIWWTGELYAVRNAGSGSIIITEFI